MLPLFLDEGLLFFNRKLFGFADRIVLILRFDGLMWSIKLHKVLKMGILGLVELKLRKWLALLELRSALCMHLTVRARFKDNLIGYCTHSIRLQMAFVALQILRRPSS